MNGRIKKRSLAHLIKGIKNSREGEKKEKTNKGGSQGECKGENVNKICNKKEKAN